MTYEELKIQLDLNESVDVLKFVGKQTKDKDWFVICNEGDCHLFNENGNEIDIKKIKSLYEKIIPKDIKKINVPDSIESIGDSAFAYCINLKSIVIPDSTKSIGNSAFIHCKSLTSINIPDSVESIGNSTFYNCKNLKSITIPDSIKGIGTDAFTYCINLTSITISDSVKNIGCDAFFNCINLKSLTFKDKTIDQVKSMEYYPWGIENKSIIRCIS